jgi:transcriptional regulator with XRE-family HTH domain
MVADIEDEVLFREWLDLQLRARRMSLRQLAERSGVNASTVSRIIRGQRRPTLRTAVRLARAVRGATDEPTASRYFGSLPDPIDPVASVERALRADGTLADGEVRNVMSLYLNLRRQSQEQRQRELEEERRALEQAGVAGKAPARESTRLRRAGRPRSPRAAARR